MAITELPNHQKSSFMQHYLENKPNMEQYFDYPNINDNDLKARYDELTQREFRREELSIYLKNFYKDLPSSERVKENIERIKDPASAVVVGGQQAGILTGPLYSIHKCITIIKYAEECEKTLGVPVIPVFWIAGEDHDYDEVNHAYVPVDQKLKKVKHGKALLKQSLTEMEFSKDSVLNWSNDLLQNLGETNYTKEIKHLLFEAVRSSETYTQYFAYVIAKLFSKYGLLLLDSGDHNLREIESQYFEQIILSNKSIDEAFRKQNTVLQNDGYPLPIEVQDNNAHLFANVRGERVLLYRTEEQNFVGKNNECQFSVEELISISRNEPYLLSNNVVTRPLMQEFLLPTLTFVGGPGEIAYWSTLRGVFHLFNRKMPPLLPRLSFTLIEPKVQKIIDEKQLDLDFILQNGTVSIKQEFVESRYDWNIEEVVKKVKEDVKNTHLSLSNIAGEVSKGLTPLASKNLDILFKQVEFLEERIVKEVERQYQHELQQFDYVEESLLPFGVPQERIWNLFYFLNHYGFDFIDDLLEQTYTFNGTHKVYNL